MRYLRSSLVMLLLMTLITGVAYPLLITGLGQWWFPAQANGSLLYRQGKVVGSALIGQSFSRDGDFQGRPSATLDSAYNPLASGGSNLATSNPALDQAIGQNVKNWRQRQNNDAPVPVDLVTASASGLDPHISPQAAQYQADRIAKARGLSTTVVEQLITRATQTPMPAFIGAPVVNVVELNLALDQIKPQP
ncbi:potassium-transporting ATPase subunit KdpC [Musicola paradisiaca]|uniref:Potassium-transporting ATPase KdpC subunit n=1 Tax=Musicola paradisiaca (strain Ech703) TaxID=579405 RepID=C6CCC2_MUSP7|nr:potassium-transporting ATPase subunit KdpC [Musicola paradisiaca]ACS84933.1 potassium-transporting ATPase, C subunit [Musicola paradisiaca Ech703]